MSTLDLRGSRPLRVTEAVASLLSAGLLMIGLAVAVLVFAAPSLIHGAGLSATDGPRIDRVLVQLGVGALGEVVHWQRGRLPMTIRPVVAVVVVAAVLAALWWGWWR